MAEVASVNIDLSALKKFSRQIDNVLQTVHKQWGARYRSFAQERFDKFSKGGGWPSLAESTLKRRRKGKGKGLTAAILRDTNTMFSVLSPAFTNQPGALQEQLTDGILVGYGGPARYSGGGKATIADIADFHQRGAGRLPQRETIVSPPSSVTDAMALDGQRALNKRADEIA